MIPVVVCYIWKSFQRLRKKTGISRNQRKNQEHPSLSIVKLGLNTQKSPGDLRRFALRMNPVKDYQLELA